MILSVFTQGLFLGFALIVAIGAQNAFVLRQGLRREKVLAVVLFCSTADALLILLGVLGLATFLESQNHLARWLAFIGAGFLFVYGVQALRRALSAAATGLQASEKGVETSKILAQAAAFTLLNPHVYLDTVILMGSIGAQHPGNLQPFFILGACIASFTWFSGLGFGARLLAPVFAKPIAWRVLDGLIAAIMWVIAAILLHQGLTRF